MVSGEMKREVHTDKEHNQPEIITNNYRVAAAI